MIPRLLIVFFRFSQPVLIHTAIRYVDDVSEHDGDVDRRGYWIILSAIFIYVGLAVRSISFLGRFCLLLADLHCQTSTAAYQHQLNRLQVLVRGSFVSLIHDKSADAVSRTYESDKAVTLMSNDVSGLETVGEMLHEGWGQFLEVAVGIFMLAMNVGWLWPLPLVFIACPYNILPF